MDVPVFQGRIARAKGHLGAFEIAVDRYAPADPASRDGFRFERPQDGAMSTCDLILDLTGETPLFTGHEKRDGYFRPDPGDPVAVQKALFELSDMVGEFAKPRYVDFHSDLCAHSRSRKTGCSRCIDVCPAGAISPDGDVVAFDPYICGGCGACNSVCPTGAAHYTFPATATLIERLTAMMQAYRDAGGRHATLFVHDSQHGGAVIDMMAASAGDCRRMCCPSPSPRRPRSGSISSPPPSQTGSGGSCSMPIRRSATKSPGSRTRSASRRRC
jgi:ferredoxin